MDAEQNQQLFDELRYVAGKENNPIGTSTSRCSHKNACRITQIGGTCMRLASNVGTDPEL
jgi:hypothetical protein